MGSEYVFLYLYNVSGHLKYICPQSWDLDFSLVCNKTLQVLYVTNFLSYVLDFGGPKVNS